MALRLSEHMRLRSRRLRQFRRPHCGSIRVDETYVKVRGEWRYLYRAIDKHGAPVDFLTWGDSGQGVMFNSA